MKGLSITKKIIRNNKYNYDFSDAIAVLKDEELLNDILKKIEDKNININSFMKDIIDIYSVVCYKDEDSKELFSKFVDLYIKCPLLFVCNNTNVFNNMITSFDDKKIVYEFYKTFIDDYKINDLDSLNEENLIKLLSYPTKARQYYFSDRSLLSALQNLLIKSDIKGYLNSRLDIDQIIDLKLEEDKIINGIYEVDAATIAELSSKISEIKSSNKSLADTIEQAKTLKSSLKQLADNSKLDITNHASSWLSKFETASGETMASLRSSYLELLSDLKKELEVEKETLVTNLSSECHVTQVEMTALFNRLKKEVMESEKKISDKTNSTMDELSDLVQNDSSVKSILDKMTKNDDLINKIDRLYEIIGSFSQDDFVRLFVPASTSQSQIVVPQIIATKEEINYDVNPILDMSKPFTERWEKVQKLKEQDIMHNGTIYHEVFDDVVKFILLGFTPYVYGPSGCGKTYMIEHQVSKLLNIDVVKAGYITYEQDLLGYTAAGNGSYVESTFHNCYKYGKIYLLDEFDNSVANAANVLNRFLEEENGEYLFPGNVLVSQHPNFRMAFCGNTSLNGRNQAHNTRSKFDESVQQRVKFVKASYDSRIDKRILENYPDWYDFSICFRNALNQNQTDPDEEVNSVGTFTTRDAMSIKKYKDNNVYDDDRIMLYEFIETKDRDTLISIKEAMEKEARNNNLSDGGMKLFKTYSAMINRKN